MKMKKALLLIVCVILLTTGCLRFDPEPTLTATISPGIADVPFQARIVCTAPPGSFTYELPDRTVETDSNTLSVTVDTLVWDATITWTDGKETRQCTVRATGSNERPVIHPPIINGKADLWTLTPFVRTLISFERSVDYAGEWKVVGITVTGDHFDKDYTVFYPPRVDGVCHAEYGFLHENSGIVYPVYVGEKIDGIPSSPTALDEGYPHIGWRNTNLLFAEFPTATGGGLEIPAQSGTITVQVRDDFGRITEATFGIPIEAVDYYDATHENGE
jgi:hypothetical protein